MTVHQAQRLAAGLGILATILLLTFTADRVWFGHAQQRAFATQSENN